MIEQLKALAEAMEKKEEAKYAIPPTHRVPGAIDFIPITIEIEACDHVWSTYKGLHEGFDYCKKCDTKRETEK